MEPTTEEVGEQEAAPQEKTPEEIAAQWLASIKEAQKLYEKKFYKRGERITKRYRSDNDEERSTNSGTKFNLFWSNVQTLAPATYSRRPKVEVSRRFRDQDPTARLAGLILERALQFEIDSGLQFHHTMQQVVLDRLLPGQGVAWVRYEPSFRTEKQKVPSPDNPVALVEEEIEVLADETTPVDYVFWKDFLVSPARGWNDVRWVGRRVMFAKDALEKRFKDPCAKFGGDVANVPCNYDPASPDPDKRQDQPSTQVEGDPSLARALIWEIRDKESKQFLWFASGYDFPLDIQDDPHKLKDFFPCPQPLWATTTTDTIVPIADYIIYNDQLRELDDVSKRISLLVSALRVIGVYDASQSALASLLQSGLENRMIPVNSWAAFAEKGGLKGSMDFLPLEQVFLVLKGLYESREALKQTIYEITGMADIVRGASVASETLGAQQIKAKFANLRLSARQQQVAEFVTGLLQIKAELMCEHYSPETLVRISAAEQISEVAEDPGRQPLPDGSRSPSPRLQAALALLKDERVSQYRIEVLASSMVELDEVDERERRNEFMSNVSNFMLAVKNIAGVAPEMMPVALEMLKFVVRGFAVGRTLEASIEDAGTRMVERMKNPQPAPLDPKIQADKEIAMATLASQERREQAALGSKEGIVQLQEAVKLSIADAKAQQDKLAQQMDIVASSMQQLEEFKHAQSQQMADHQHQAQETRTQLEAQMRQAQEQAVQEAKASAPDLSPLADGQNALRDQLAQLMETMSRPRVRQIHTDAEGIPTHMTETLQ